MQSMYVHVPAHPNAYYAYMYKGMNICIYICMYAKHVCTCTCAPPTTKRAEISLGFKEAAFNASWKGFATRAYNPPSSDIASNLSRVMCVLKSTSTSTPST